MSRAADAAYRARNRDKLRAKQVAYRERGRVVNAAYYLAHKDRVQARARRQRAISRLLIRSAKAQGCVDCGETDLDVLDLDHVEGQKVAPVGSMYKRAVPVLIAEIAKCEPRCANCHRRITARRRAA